MDNDKTFFSWIFYSAIICIANKIFLVIVKNEHEMVECQLKFFPNESV